MPSCGTLEHSPRILLHHRRSFFCPIDFRLPIHQFPLTNGTVWLICTCTNIRPCVTTTSFGTKHSIVILWQALLWFITFGKGKLLRCFLTMKDQVPLRFTGCKLLWIREPVVNRRRRVFRGAIIHNKLDFMGGWNNRPKTGTIYSWTELSEWKPAGGNRLVLKSLLMNFV